MTDTGVRKCVIVLCLAVSSFFIASAFMYHVATPLLRENIITYEAGNERGDFLRTYIAAQMSLTGQAAWVYDRSAFLKELGRHESFNANQITAWQYSPIYVLLVQPLANFSYKTAFTLSLLVQLILFFAISYRFLWCSGIEALILFSPTLFAALAWGQNGALMAALYIGAFRYLRAQPWLSGVFFGCCIIKPQLGLLVPILLLAGKHYRVFVAACFTVLLLVLLSVLAYGVQPWENYLQGMAPGLFGHANTDVSLATNTLTTSTNYRMPSVYNMFRLMGLEPTASLALQALVALWCVWQVFMLGKRNNIDPLAALVAFSLLSLLTFPYFGIYDYALATTATLGVMLRTKTDARFNLSIVMATLSLYYIVMLHAGIILSSGLILTPIILFFAYFAWKLHGLFHAT